jgi:4-amino-4-deoxy-L-arabinose transferase-like glycosyltransferase
MASSAGRTGAFAGGDWAFTISLLVVALAARVLVALVFAREPVWDGHYYHFGAERLASGLGYSEDVTVAGRKVWKAWSHYPVGYSAFLSVFYRVFGSGIGTAPVVGAVTGSVLVALVHRLGRYMTSTNRARIAGALAALHPGLILYSGVVMTELLAGTLLLAAAWSALGIRNRWARLIVAGVLFGCGALVRPASLLVLPALAFCTGRSLWQKLWQTALIGAVALVVIAPWTARNCRVMDGCALISTNGGWNLAIGALTETGRFQTLRAGDGCPVVSGQVQQDSC